MALTGRNYSFSLQHMEFKVSEVCKVAENELEMHGICITMYTQFVIITSQRKHEACATWIFLRLALRPRKGNVRRPAVVHRRRWGKLPLVVMLSEGKTCLLRSAIFVGLTSVVTTIIYLTPVPGKILPVSSECFNRLHY